MEEKLNEEIKHEDIKSPLLNDTDVHDTEIVENKEQSFIDVFTDSVDCAKQMGKIKGYSNSLHSQLSELTKNVSTDKKSIQEKEIDNVYNEFKLLNVEEENLSDEQVEYLLRNFSIDEQILTDKTTSADFKEYKRAILSFIINTRNVDEITNNAEKELQKLQNDFKNELDDILGDLNLSDRLSKISEAIKNENDPKQKKKLQEIYAGIYSSVSLNIITNKVKNKGLKQIKKECRSNYEKSKIKAFKILKNDKNNMFLNPKLIEETIQTIFPDENKENIKILLYLVFKKINKRNTLDRTTATFINYFIITLNKLVNKDYADEKEDNDLYKNMKLFFKSLNG